MQLKYSFVCPLPNGVHARPASLLEELARNFSAEILLINQRTGCVANAKSVLAMISADIRHNDECLLMVSGSDKEAAMSTLSTFVKEHLPGCDDAPPVLPVPNGKSCLPAILQGASITVLHGTPVVSGVSHGRLLRVGGFNIPATLALKGAPDSAAEIRLLDDALHKVSAFYDAQLMTAQKKVEVELLKAHRAIARDSEFCHQLRVGVSQHQQTLAGAVAATKAHFTKLLSAGSALLRERVLDIQDVCAQLLRQAYGNAVGTVEIKLDADTIIVAESLTPGQFLALDRKFFKGLVLAHAGTTSHTVILARSFGIPTLVSVTDLANVRFDQQEAVIDADAGLLLTNLTETVRRYYAMERQRLQGRQLRVQQFASRPAVTQDGHRLEIGANIASADEAAAAFVGGAEGIGLFRTEMLFLDRERAPDEIEQFETYRRVLLAAGSQTVIIRTLDIGGDKPLDYLKLAAEENPFLGYRALRVYPEFELLFRTQIRALVRASALGRLKPLLPMVSTVAEVRWAKKIILEEQEKCQAEKIPFDAAMPVGAMIEVPAAAFIVPELGRELDFFCIGSNDLLQYFMAVDRTDARLAELYNPFQPSFLRLLKQIVQAAHASKKWIGLCGEIGGQIQFLPLLAGLGLDEISMAAPAIAGIKAELTALKFADCRHLLDAALNCSTANEVATLLGGFTSQSDTALAVPELVILNSEALTKEEVIKQAVDRLYVLGRTEDSRAVEDAVWKREQNYSTGFGHGFAIPHCKTNAMRINSLVLLKLRSPVKWNSLDGESVTVVILFAVRETNSATEHMKVFAKLARQLMNEKFRESIKGSSAATELCEMLSRKVEVKELAGVETY